MDTSWWSWAVMKMTWRKLKATLFIKKMTQLDSAFCIKLVSHLQNLFRQMKGTVDHTSSTCNLKRQKYHRKEIFKLETWQDSEEFSTKQGGKVGQVRSTENIPASFLVTANKHFVVSSSWRQEELWENMALCWIGHLFYGWIPSSVGSHGFSNHHAKHHSW